MLGGHRVGSAARPPQELDVPWVCLVSQDAFYRVLNKEQMKQAHNNEFDFDHPDAMDLELMADTLRKLKAGKQVEVGRSVIRSAIRSAGQVQSALAARSWRQRGVGRGSA